MLQHCLEWKALLWRRCIFTRLPTLLLWRFIKPRPSLVSDSLASINNLANFSPNFTLLLHPVQSNSPLISLLLPLVLVGSQAQLSSEPLLQAFAKECTTPADVIECINATSLLPVIGEEICILIRILTKQKNTCNVMSKFKIEPHQNC